MLRVTIDLLPYGDIDRKREIKVIDIANDGKGTQEFGNYLIREDGGKWQPSVLNWPRSKSAEALVGEALSIFYAK